VPGSENALGAGVTRPAGRWREIAQSAEFRRLEARRRRATVTTLGIFAVVFGTFLVLSGYARPFMRRSVDGGLTVAYVWVLGLTVLAWVLIWAYLRVSRQLVRMSQEILERAGDEEGAR
jgi:uncharacterized membrane protein (DUF485 family)